MKHGRSQPISAYTSTPLLHLHVLCCFAALASLLSVLSPVRAASDADDIAKYCPTECSGLPVHYPFGTVPAPGASSRLRCGSPAFQLRCDGHSAVWDAQSVSALQITAINYTSRSIDVRDNLMSNCTEFTPLMPQLLNLDQQFNFTPFTIANVSVSTSVRILVFGCSPLPTLDSVSGFTYSSTACQTFYSSCLKGQAEIPAGCFEAVSILADIASLVGKYGCSYYTSFYNLPSPLPPSFSFPADNTGVQLLWANVDHQDACDKCVSTNGKCGFDEKVSQRFVCLCSGSKYSSTNCSAPDLLDFPAGCSGSLCGRNLKLAIALPIVAFMAVLGATFYCVIWRRKKRQQMHFSRAPNGFSVDGLTEKPFEFSYKELAIATNFFSLKLGEGAFGMVYQGLLRNGDSIAVKVLDGSRQGDIQFVNEVASIGTIHHVNLVKLVGFCYENSNRILVYEYIVNSSLDKHLFTESRPNILDWNRRYSIALGTARGLAYLHRDCRKRIIHCDIKPQNILLDSDFCPKIADFGLAKLMNKDQSQALTTVRGTPGYIAPEFWSLRDGPLTEKCDVYSFGMVLFEIIGGRRNMDLKVSVSQLYFPEWVSKQVRKEFDVLLLVDKRMASDASDRGQVREQVKVMCMVALWCIQEEASMRPSMGRVVQYLEGSVEVPMNPPFPFKTSNVVVDVSRKNSVTTTSSSF